MVAAYSGGRTRQRSVLHAGRADDRLRGVVLFDALYGEHDKFLGFRLEKRPPAFFVSLAMVAKSKTILGVNYVPTSEVDNIFGLVTPAFMGYLMQVKEFASADYVDAKPFTGRPGQMLRWFGINWIESPLLTGTGTAQEKCYLFHRNAIGHALDKNSLESPVGYEEKQAISWARVSGFFGSKLLQNGGIVQMRHDGSAYVAG